MKRLFVMQRASFIAEETVGRLACLIHFEQSEGYWTGRTEARVRSLHVPRLREAFIGLSTDVLGNRSATHSSFSRRVAHRLPSNSPRQRSNYHIRRRHLDDERIRPAIINNPRF